MEYRSARSPDPIDIHLVVKRNHPSCLVVFGLLKRWTNPGRRNVSFLSSPVNRLRLVLVSFAEYSGFVSSGSLNCRLTWR